MNRTIVLLGFFLFLTTNITAQTSFANNSSFLINNSELLNINDEDWSFYADDENNLIYIDFENINLNLSELIIKNNSNEIIYKEDLLDLPVNTIYELDLNEYAHGKYHLELKSFTKTIEKEIDVK